MPVAISWVLDKRIIWARVYGKITDADDEQFDERILEYLDRGDGLPVHIVTDSHDLEMIETVIRPALTNTRSAQVTNHPALGCQVMCGADNNPLTRYLGPFDSYALKPCTKKFDTLEHAIEYLAEVDSTLSPNSSPDGRKSYPKPA